MAVRSYDDDVSLAQVEAELRAAEAYLTLNDATASTADVGGTDASSNHDVHMLAAPSLSDVSGLAYEAHLRAPSHVLHKRSHDFLFQMVCSYFMLGHAIVLQEDRRKEVLAKLSSERQAALRVRAAGSPVYSEDSVPPDGMASRRSKLNTPEGRSQRIQNTFRPRGDKANRRSEETTTDVDSFPQVDALCPFGSPRSDISRDYDVHSAAFSDDNDEGELFYASDIIGNPSVADVQPRSRIDFLHVHDDDAEGDQQPTHSPSALFAQALAREYEETSAANGHNARSMVAQDDPAIAIGKPEDEKTAALPARWNTASQSYQEQHRNSSLKSWSPGAEACKHTRANRDCSRAFVPEDESFRDTPRRATAGPALSERVAYLAQPRSDKFSEREKQRLQLEMESLQECTFRPNLTKPQSKNGSGADAVQSSGTKQQDASTRSGAAAFPWLMLSPRRRSSPAPKSKVTWNDSEASRGQNVIERLHLDGTAKYEQRERAKAELEARRLRECTFRPKINDSSRGMLNMARYKPIHERVCEIQRAKADYIRRIQEQIEEGGLAAFTPTINPRSREIAATVLMERELEEYDDDSSHSEDPEEHRGVKPPKIVDRLVNDAEKQIEKRMAIQEYYDALQHQSYAPKISENSNRIVQQKPEFKMDFVSRQMYFQSREQEKLEALEDYCERAQNDGERITFKPDIGNANNVLKELRPDRFSESTNQKLYRMIYKDPKKTELKKQRLREEHYSKYTFKPAINPISKALGRPSTLAELSHPVIDLGQDRAEPLASPDRKSTARATERSRAALQQYFAGKRFRSRVALEMDQAEKAECTFQPTLISKPRAKGNSSSTSKLYTKQRQGKSIWRSDNILHLIETDRQKKAEELEAKRNELELKELQECTFQPNLRKNGNRACGSGCAPANRSASPSTHRGSSRRENAQDRPTQKPVIVRGLGRFLELKEQAKRLQAEQKQREEKAFRPNAVYEPRSYTVPKPFNLSGSSKDAIRRRSKLREEVRAKERIECTFVPHTIESQHRKVLQNILNG